MIDDLNPQPAPAKAPKFKYQLEALEKQQQQQRALGLPPRSSIAATPTPATPLAKSTPTPKPTASQKKAKSKTNPKQQKGYQAAVPITVYRELAQEVQDLRAEIAQIRELNNQLTTENQQMHRTLTSIATAVETVGIVASAHNPAPTYTDYAEPEESLMYPQPSEPSLPEPYETDGEDWVMSMQPPDQHPLIERLRNGEFSSILTWVIIVSLFILTVGGSFFLVNLVAGQGSND